MSDPDGFTEVVVFERRDGSRELRKTGSGSPPDTNDVSAWGFGELQNDGFDDVREAIDLEDYDDGEHVATIYLDTDEWTYWLEWEVSFPVRERVERVLTGWFQ